MTPRDQLLSAVDGLRVWYAPRWDDPAIAGTVGEFRPDWVMLHHTAGTNSRSVLINAYPSGTPGAHVLVNRDGSVCVLSRFTCYHAGKGAGFGVPRDGMNPRAWGIEIEDPGLAQTMTGAQIETVARLSAGLLRAMGRGLAYLIQHKAWSSTGKVDTLYPDTFWRTAASAFPTPTTEEPDMDLNDAVALTESTRAGLGTADDTMSVAGLLQRAALGSSALVVAKRTEEGQRRLVAEVAGLRAATEALAAGRGLDLAAIRQQIDEALAAFVTDVEAEVTVTVAPPQV